MSNANNVTVTGWTFKHEGAVDASGYHHGVAPQDALGLKLRLESGYTWLNKNDGMGWIQTSIMLRRATIRERVMPSVV